MLSLTENLCDDVSGDIVEAVAPVISVDVGQKALTVSL